MLLKATLIYRRTGNLRAVQLSLGHTKIERALCGIGIDVDDALATYDVRRFERFRGKVDMDLVRCTCLLLTQSGHCGHYAKSLNSGFLRDNFRKDWSLGDKTAPTSSNGIPSFALSFGVAIFAHAASAQLPGPISWPLHLKR